MEFYYLFFLLILLIGIVGTFLNNKYQNYVLYCMAGLMTLFQGLRWNTGADWYQFYWYFDNASWNILSYLRMGGGRLLEPGYVLLNIVIKTIYNSYTLFLLITCAFVNCTYVFWIKKLIRKNLTFVFAIVLLNAPYFPVRQQLAATIFLWGVQFIYNRELKKYLVVVAIATTIHYSSIILIPFYWINKNVKWWVLTLIYVSCPIITTYLPFIFKPFQELLNVFAGSGSSLLFNQYIEGANMAHAKISSDDSNLSIYSLVTICMFGYLKDNFLKLESRGYASIFLNIYVIGVIGLLIGGIPGFNEFRRLSYYSLIRFGVLFGLSFNISRRQLDNVFISFLLVFVFSFSYNHLSKWLVGIYSDLYVPYYSVFEGDRHPIRELR